VFPPIFEVNTILESCSKWTTVAGKAPVDMVSMQTTKFTSLINPC